MQIPFFRKKRKAPEYNTNKVYTNNFACKKNTSTVKNSFFKQDKWIYIASLFILILCILIILFRAERYQIKKVNIETTQNINITQISNLVNEYLAQPSLIIFKKSNKYLFSKQEVGDLIRKNLLDQVVIKSLDINLSADESLNINIKEQLPNLIWQTGELDYFMDLDGIITSRATLQEDEKFLPKIIDLNNLSIEINQQIISKELIDFIILTTEEFPKEVGNEIAIDFYQIPEIKCQQRIIQSKETGSDREIYDENLENKKREIQERFKNSEISIDESLELLESLRREYLLSNQTTASSKEIDELIKIEYEEIFEDFPCNYPQTIKDIKLVTNEGWYIYLTTYLDFTTQAENFNTVLMENIVNRENLEYIDVRFDDRVYFK